MRKSIYFLWLAFFGAFGCSPPEDKITLVRMDLAVCLGEALDGPQRDYADAVPIVDSTCRATLEGQIDTESPTNACLIVETAGDRFSVGFRYSDGALGPPQSDVPLQPGKGIRLGLFFLSRGGGPTVCDGIEAATTCADTPNCVLRLYEDRATPDADGTTVITFSRRVGDRNQCAVDYGSQFEIGVSEACDGLDNDCDGEADEDFFRSGDADGGDYLGEQCTGEGMGVCTNVNGAFVCNEDGSGVRCEGPALEQRRLEDELCDADGPDTYDTGEGFDDDCDGVVDEGQPCFVCEVGDEAPHAQCAGNVAGEFCVDSRCVTCLEGSHAGCQSDQICCASGGDRPACIQTDTEQCFACEGGACGTDANRCEGRECVCHNFLGGACGGGLVCLVDPEDPNDPCVACSTHDDCAPSELCCSGVCQEGTVDSCTDCGVPCTPPDALAPRASRCDNRMCMCAGAEACDGTGATPVCRPEYAPNACQGCRPSTTGEPNQDCPVGWQCNQVLENPPLFRCVECTENVHCPDGFCVNSRCQVCDPTPERPPNARDYGYPGCDPEGGLPVCRVVGNDGEVACTACVNGEHRECQPPNIDREVNDPFSNVPSETLFYCFDGGCRVCLTEDNSGCNDRTRPICSITESGDFGCRPCQEGDSCGAERLCATSGPLRGQCLGCNVENDSGCDPLRETPICVDGACEGCRNDGQCPSGADLADSVRVLCVGGDSPFGGRCQECDPLSNRGCDIRSNAPVCLGETETCGACRNDNDCVRFEDGVLSQCVDGLCRACDPATDDGCDGASTLRFCGDDRVCRGCINDLECREGLDPQDALGVTCDLPTGECLGCTEGTNAGCDSSSDSPICDAGTCRSCLNSGECQEDTVCVRGRCQECDPDTHEQCDENSLTPFCAPVGECVACSNDFECRARPGILDTCVNGQCRECDHLAGTNRGCDESSTSPICRLEDGAPRCAGCAGAADCDPLLCDEVDGRCAACQPSVPGLVGQRGCGVASIAPICDRNARTCRPCQNGECEFGSLQFCFNGMCLECDPLAQQGCDPNGRQPICSGILGECIGCRGNFDCIEVGAAGGQCVDGACVQCNPDGDVGCDEATPICDDADQRCRGCQGDGECAGATRCVGGRCVGCNPEVIDSCPPERPFCNPEGFECEPCTPNQGQCPDELLCVNGRCELCDALDNRGCDLGSQEPICLGVEGCGPCGIDADCAVVDQERGQCVIRGAGDRRCEECDPVDGAGCDLAQAPICDELSRTCRACQDGSDECPDEGVCIGGQCRTCAPGGDAPHQNCDAAQPICDADSFNCRLCEADGECGDGECVQGRCEACDPATNDGCNGDQPICLVGADGPACVGCSLDAQCALDVQQADYCGPNGACVSCLPDGDAGCTNPAPICNAESFECEACVGAGQGNCGPGRQCVDGECSGCNPANNSGCGGDNPICNAATGECERCERDEQCGDDICVAGRCQECALDSHAGCNGATEICCRLDGEPRCLPTSADGRCTACDQGCGTGALDCTGRQCACGGLGECGAGTPFCIGAAQSRICSQCRDNSDCIAESNTPFCNVQLGVCESCLGQDGRCGDNPNGRRCVTAGPRLGECSDCDPGRVSGQNGCMRTSARPSCHAGLAECVPCTSADGDGCTQHPASERVCLSEGDNEGRCAECDPVVPHGSTTCDVDGVQPECGATGECRGCLDDDVCQASSRGRLCNEESGQCGCVVANDCGIQGQVCRDGICGACILGAENSLCAPGQICDAGACGPCSDRLECAPGEICNQGACGPCEDNDQCLAGELCIAGVCDACDPSAVPTQCEGGQVCSDGACGPCEGDESCDEGLVCDMGRCQ